MEHDQPLVSIIVITYNSAKYVLETLESAKEQTYQNIELIVSDDCSTDNTVEICRTWLTENESRFVHTELITVEKNTGIPANCNRGVRAVKGKWVKLIGGDDALYPDSIKKIIIAVSEHSEIEILLTHVEVFDRYFISEHSRGVILKEWQNLEAISDNTSTEIQIEYLLKGNYFPSPGLFIKQKVFEDVGGFDVNYNLIEDVPFLLSILFNKKKIIFNPIKTVKYRKHSENLTAKGKNILPLYNLQYIEVLYKASIRYGKKKYIINNYWNLLFIKLIFKLGNTGKLCLFLNKIRINIYPLRFYNLFIKIHLI